MPTLTIYAFISPYTHVYSSVCLQMPLYVHLNQLCPYMAIQTCLCQVMPLYAHLNH